MPIRSALKEQYHAALAMMEDCVAKCPDDLWTAPSRSDPYEDAPGRCCTRSFWRIAFHGIYFTHLYMGQSVEDFEPPTNLLMGVREDFKGLWDKSWDLDPFEIPEGVEPVSREEMIQYLRWVDSRVDPTLDGLDLDSQESGIPWYKKFPKLNHELLTLRHLQGHVGQLSELLMAREIDSDWVSRVKPSGA
ncbi:MAG: DinB family protein [Fimbriimonadaceae bacterium]|nr:hypothetical protein [Fimbriimonadaceae bacterium]MCL4285496.1 DinB family protein [Fimbriimonadaceae bacterium]QOJ10760.1 MAG: DinB family protein [Chthonomonadaceae bacterium]